MRWHLMVQREHELGEFETGSSSVIISVSKPACYITSWS